MREVATVSVAVEQLIAARLHSTLYRAILFPTAAQGWPWIRGETKGLSMGGNNKRNGRVHLGRKGWGNLVRDA